MDASLACASKRQHCPKVAQHRSKVAVESPTKGNVRNRNTFKLANDRISPIKPAPALTPEFRTLNRRILLARYKPQADPEPRQEALSPLLHHYPCPGELLKPLLHLPKLVFDANPRYKGR